MEEKKSWSVRLEDGIDGQYNMRITCPDCEDEVLYQEFFPDDAQRFNKCSCGIRWTGHVEVYGIGRGD